MKGKKLFVIIVVLILIIIAMVIAIYKGQEAIKGGEDNSAAVSNAVEDGESTTPAAEADTPQAERGKYIDSEDWTDLLKGGADYQTLEYMLEVISRCEYEKEDDYLKNALYWMCDKSNPVLPIEPIEVLENGESIYDVAALNEIFSVLTTDTISEDNLNTGINRLEGEKLICTTSPTSNNKVASAGIDNAHYGEADEIIVEYLFNVVDTDTFEVERFQKKAYLVTDETGKYILSHIE